MKNCNRHTGHAFSHCVSYISETVLREDEVVPVNHRSSSFDALFAVYNVANEIEDIIAEPTRI